MQTVNLTLMWWLGHGATAPEAIVVYEVLSPAKKALCRFALGPEVWTPRAEFDASGEWLGTVTPPMRAYHPVFTPPTVDKGDELPPPPPEIVVPVYADPTPTLCALSESGVSESEGSEDKGDADNSDEGGMKRRGPPATVCPPEVEALLGTDKDTLIAAQTGFSVHLITKWRTERDIPRHIKGGNAPKPEAPVRAAPVEVDESALANIINHRFSDGASDEDMAQEAGVSVAKVVEVRIALGLRRPRGRKPGVPQGPRKAKTDAAEVAAVEQKAENEPDDERVPVSPASEGTVDAELDALLA